MISNQIIAKEIFIFDQSDDINIDRYVNFKNLNLKYFILDRKNSKLL